MSLSSITWVVLETLLVKVLRMREELQKSGYEFENEKIKMKISIVSHELTHCILFPDTVFEDSEHLVSGYRVGKNAVRIE